MHATMSSLNDKVKDRDQCILELKSGGQQEGAPRERPRRFINVVIVDLSNKAKALEVAVAGKDMELNACKKKLEALEGVHEELKTQVKLCIAVVTNGVAKQVTSTLKVQLQNLQLIMG